MKLRWLIYGRHCLTVETGGGKAVSGIEWEGEALRRVSAGWSRPPRWEAIEHWLRGALPENGGFESFERRAQEMLTVRGMDIGQGTMHDWVWANADWEYPGAVHFEREEDRGRREEEDGYVPLDENEVGEKLREAATDAAPQRRLRREGPYRSKSALSGAQGKLGVHIDDAGRVLLPRGRALSTWILKVESRPQEWPGESAIESICQRALAHLGIEAAETRAQVIDGVAVVMSRRSDRHSEGGRIGAVHQEDWLQAYGKNRSYKYDIGGNDSGYASLYAILRRYADDPGREVKQLTRVLAAMCAMANGDLHRKNLGLLHRPFEERFRIRLAPVYDFSSQLGVPRTGDGLEFGIGGMKRAWEVGERRWRAHAQACKLDPDTTLATVRETVAAAPEALAAAREERRGVDEHPDPKQVENRMETVIKAARHYAEVMGVGRPQGNARPGEREGKSSEAHEGRGNLTIPHREGAESKARDPTAKKSDEEPSRQDQGHSGRMRKPLVAPVREARQHAPDAARVRKG